MPSVNWASSTLQAASAQRVYIRQSWGNAWSYQPSIWCSELSWSLLPSMPIAQLERDYGGVLPHNSGPLGSWINQGKVYLGGWYVKIEVDCADGMLTWYGFIDEQSDAQGGVVGSVASGRQNFVAYSMAQSLAFEYMTRSRWYDQPNTVNRWSGSAISFNQGGKPNRTQTAPTADPGKAQVHLFAPTAPTNRRDTAFDIWDPAQYWTSRKIVEYLEQYHMPLNQGGGQSIRFRIDGKGFLPDWDKPTIDTEGKSVLSVLEELVNPSRLLQLSTLVDESTTPQTVVLKIHSLADAPLALPGSFTHFANPDVLTIAAAAAQDTRLVIQSSESATANQVVMKGAKRQTVGTVVVLPDSDVTGDSEALVEGWTEDLEDEYNEGASLESGYGALTDDEKREANQIVRAKSSLDDVFRTFVINPKWDFAGFGAYPFFVDDDFSRYFPWWNDISFAPNLPLREGSDYSSIPAADDDAKREFRPPFVLFKRPDAAKYLQAEKMSNREANPAFSVEVGISKDGQGLTLDVSGAEQHAIAYTRFVALPVDYTDGGDWDYFETRLTVALTEDRFAEYAFPPGDDLPVRDAVRKKIIYAGESYKLIRDAGGTEWTFDNDGAPVATTGTVNWFNDDRGRLQALGQIAASWFLVPRQILRLVSARPSATPLVGQLVGYVNPGTPHEALINSVVSEIRLSMPRAETLSASSYSLVTALGELNPLAFDPTLPAAGEIGVTT
jgi:hypothetical protein